jgi:hypothetical protein
MVSFHLQENGFCKAFLNAHLLRVFMGGLITIVNEFFLFLAIVNNIKPFYVKKKKEEKRRANFQLQELFFFSLRKAFDVKMTCAESVY